MKKIFRAAILLLVSVMLLSGLTACGKPKGFRLSYYDGQAEDGSYNADLFHRNDFTIFSGDPSIVWVSEEESSEYGGFFYMYCTSNDGVITQWFDADKSFAFPVLRSKDMADWTPVGGVDGLCSLLIESDEWLLDYTWAPEVIRDPETGKYFMYFSGRSRMPRADSDVANECVHSDKSIYERFYLGVAVSDTPVGPFRLVSSENYYGDAEKPNPNGKVITAKNPAINFTQAYYGKGAEGAVISEENPFACIDAHMFFDHNGDKYLYFVKHVTNLENTNSLWVVKMLDMMTPDYSTIRKVSTPSKKVTTLVENSKTDGNPLGEYTTEGSVVEGTINEGPQVLYNPNSGKYYLTYSPHGFSSRHYSVVQAVGDSPYGPFTKLEGHEGRVVMGADNNNDYITSTGHHCFVKVGDEMFCAYFASADPKDGSVIARWGRGYGFDRVQFAMNDDLGYEILYGSGPTLSLQPLPEITSEYKNVAKNAKITATNTKTAGSEKYLNDGLITSQESAGSKEFSASKETTITIEFSQPTVVKAIMFYNSYSYFNAFSGIDLIQFTLSEKPAWYTGSEKGFAFIDDLAFPSQYYDTNEYFMRPGGSAMAEFNEITVTKIEIKISNRLSALDADNNPSNQINVSEIVVLGKSR